MGRDYKNIPYWKRLTDITGYVKKMEKKWKDHYNVYIYNNLKYPQKDFSNILNIMEIEFFQ